MSVLTYRPLIPDDAPAILRIELAAESAEPAQTYADLTEIQENMSLPGVDLERGSVAVLDEDRLVAYGALLVTEEASGWAAHLSGSVLPEFRRRGIGRDVLARLSEKAKAKRDGDRPGQPGELKLWVQHGRVSATGFAASAGFTTRRYFFDMRAPLGAMTIPTTPQAWAEIGDDIEIRPWSPADDEGTRLAYNSAFADHWGSSAASVERWRKTFAESSFFRAEFSRVAIRDGQVVGFVLADEFDSETAARGYRTGYIDRVGTVRSVRGRGIAAALVTDCMAALSESGCRYAELGVDADSPTGAGRLYERLGFTVQHRNEVFGLDF